MRNIILASILAVFSYESMAYSVNGEVSRTPAQAKSVEVLKSSAPFMETSTRMEMGELSSSRITSMINQAAIENERKALATPVAINRDVFTESLPGSDRRLEWFDINGGKVARVTFDVENANGIRLGFKSSDFPNGSEIRVFSGDTAIQTVKSNEIRNLTTSEGIYWGPITFGASQNVELFVPNGQITPATVPVRSVSHFFKLEGRVGPELAGALSCMISVDCQRKDLGQSYTAAENAVAKMFYVRHGGGWVCTGSLINDSDATTQIPYFLTAEHCVGDDDSAKSLITYWEAESRTCGSGFLNQYYVGGIPHRGGASIVNVYKTHDITLLRLNNPAPANAYFLGWDSTVREMEPEELEKRYTATVVHHPAGENKAVSKVRYFRTLGYPAGDYHRGGSHLVNAMEGSFAGGSSGSALLRNNGGNYQLIGTLIGTTGGGCSNVGAEYPLRGWPAGNLFIFSRFDYWYELEGHKWLGVNRTNLNGSNSAQASWNYSGAWFVPANSGWGATVAQFADQILVLMFIYNEDTGEPEWIQIQGKWTGQDEMTANIMKRTNFGNWGDDNFKFEDSRDSVVGTATLTFRTRDVMIFDATYKGRKIYAEMRMLE